MVSVNNTNVVINADLEDMKAMFHSLTEDEMNEFVEYLDSEAYINDLSEEGPERFELQVDEWDIDIANRLGMAGGGGNISEILQDQILGISIEKLGSLTLRQEFEDLVETFAAKHNINNEDMDIILL